MIRAFVWGTSAAVAGAGLLALGFLAGQPATASGLNAPDMMTVAATDTPMDRQQVETIVREYLLANPEILLEVQQALDTKQKEEQRVAQTEIIKSAKDEIFASPHDGIIGNPNGKVTIVEFYDYNCGYCKRAQQDMLDLVAADSDLRFVLKEFPILGPDSQKAHVVAQAFMKLHPEKYEEYHNRLIVEPGRAGEESAMKLALDMGADETKMREQMKDPSIQEAFAKTYELAQKLSITGTPSYVVGNEVVFGALGRDVLAEKIETARACIADATC
ncbi:MAG: DsbA family protein [Rhizobiaceae bacterium]